MKKWFPLALIIVFFVLLAILFVVPTFSYHCTEKLIDCVDEGKDSGLLYRMWVHLKCVFYNVICVLGGVF